LTSTAVAEYRSDIEEFDHFWNTGTTQEQQKRMPELVNKIEAFEKDALY
jgi:hypothetical protein